MALQVGRDPEEDIRDQVLVQDRGQDHIIGTITIEDRQFSIFPEKKKGFYYFFFSINTCLVSYYSIFWVMFNWYWQKYKFMIFDKFTVILMKL